MATETTSATVETTVEIPTIDDRKLEKFFILVDRHGEVDHIGSDRDEAEAALRANAHNRNGMGANPSLFLLEVEGVPTDAALAEAAKDKKK